MPHTTNHWTLMLNSGGMQSLVATALHAGIRQAYLFIHDGRPNGEQRHICFIQQAEHFSIGKRQELVMPHLAASGAAVDVTQPPPRHPMADVQILAAAVGVAAQLKAERLIWPQQVGPRFADLARVTESVQLLQQIFKVEHGHDIVIETPLLEMTDRQLVEVGHQLNVPWQMARSCDTPRHDPCGECHGCRKRHEAFHAAGMEDPLLSHSH